MPTTLQPNLYIAVGVTLVAATTTLAFRFAARRVTRMGLWWDDFLCIGAFIFAVLWSATVIAWCIHGGLGLHLEDIQLPEDQILFVNLKYLYFVELTYATSLAFSKVSILAFYWRVFESTNMKLPLLVLLVASIVWWILRTFIAIFHCLPVEAFWNKNIPGATCSINDSTFFFYSVLAHLILDILIILLPIWKVRTLQLRTYQKVGVSLMFTFGIFVCAASIFVLVYSAEFDPTAADLPFNVALIITWATVEVNMAVLSACLPSIRPVLKKVLDKFKNSSSFDSTGDRYKSSNGFKMNTFHKIPKDTGTTTPTESTHELTNDATSHSHSKGGGGSDLSSDRFGGGADDRSPSGLQTTISPGRPDSDLERAGHTGRQESLAGIMVHSEVKIQVSSKAGARSSRDKDYKDPWSPA